MLFFPVLAVICALFSTSNGASPLSSKASNVSAPIVQLPYGTFQGSYSSTYNITYFRKIPFAAPPVGINRFRAPQPPEPITNGTYDSSATFDFCPQRTVNGSEDCLYLGLYSRPWTASQHLRSVVVNFYGGAFIEGGGSFNLPPPAYPVLNASTENDYILVEPNYRVNAFGFLPGKIIAEDPNSDLNVGLLDQHAVLKWVHTNIRLFGGDPSSVTIWGQSAGAGSVVAQSIANTTTQKGLIARALMSSPFWPKTYHYSSPEAESIYTTFAALANCSGPNSLECLKAAPVQTLRTAALAISGSHTYNTSSYTWAPVTGDSFLPLPLSQAATYVQSNLADSAWGMYNLHEGQNFVPPGLQNATTNVSAPAGSGTSFNNSAASFEQWVTGFLPTLSPAQMHELVTVQYPPSGTAENLPTYNTSFIRAGLIYRDVVLACPAFWIAQATASKKGAGASTVGKGYMGTYTIPPATHGSDTEWWDTVSSVQKSNPIVYDGFAGAFASYFAAGDPNAHKLTNSSQAGVPGLELSKGKGEEWVIESSGFMQGGISELEGRCEFWKSVAGNIPI